MLSLNILTLATLAFMPQDLEPAPSGSRGDLGEYDLRTAQRITPTVLVVNSAAPAVVFIRTGQTVIGRNLFGDRVKQRQESGAGSGVVIREEGFIVTNYHVVRGADEIHVEFLDETTYPAQLVSYQESEDLALLKIEAEEPLPTVPLGTSSDLMIGEDVIAIGNPYGHVHTVSRGIISGLHRDVQIPGQDLAFDDLIQTDASINLGNSGGPLLNILGELIGINTVMNTQAENIGFAIPIDRIRQVLEEQLLAPEAARAWLGFQLEPGDSMRISRVFEGGPAGLAGIQPGDQLLQLGSKATPDPESYRLVHLGLPPGQPVEVVVERGGTRDNYSLAPWDKPDGLLYERLGLTVSGVALGSRGERRAVRVAHIRAGGPADQVGLASGDLVDALRARGNPRAWRIQTRENLARLIAPLEPGTGLEIDVFRDMDGDQRFERNELLRGELALD